MAVSPFPDAPEPRAPVRFGPFTLDVQARLLTRDASPIHLTPKAFELLLLLVEDAPRVVTKAQLHERLWADTFVSDATLVGLVKEVRRALGDTGEAEGGLIRTAHRVGYALAVVPTAVAPLRPAGPAVLIDRRRVPLKGGETIVGRDRDCDLPIGDSLVSRRHARIVVTAPDAATIEDLDSKNGTLVGGRRITGPTPLRHRDEIQIGAVTLVFDAAVPSEPTLTMPELPLE